METRPRLDRCVDIIKSAKEREEYRELEFQATRAAPRERDPYSRTMGLVQYNDYAPRDNIYDQNQLKPTKKFGKEDQPRYHLEF